MTVIGLDPTGTLASAPDRTLAARKPSLDGAVVGLVSNGVGRSTEFLQAVYDRLAERYALAGALAIGKPNRSVPPTAADWRRLTTETDVVLAGFGGCGSCSSRSLRDALELEWAGVPSVALVHRQQLPGVSTMARMSGFPDYPYVVVDDRYASLATWTDEEIAAIADQIVDQVVNLLVAA